MRSLRGGPARRCFPIRRQPSPRFHRIGADIGSVERIRRFTKSERAAHWLVAAAFAVMLLTGGQVPHHWTWTTPALDVHVGAAVVLMVGLGALLLFGNRGALRATAR